MQSFRRHGQPRHLVPPPAVAPRMPVMLRVDARAARGRRRRGAMMSLRAGQRRSLDRIERTLLDDDLRLGSLFEIFTRLARDEAMPLTERVMAGPRRRLRPWRRLRPALVAAAGLTAVVTVLMLSLLVPGRQACQGGAAAGPAHMQPFRAGWQATCRQTAQAANPAAGPDGR